MRSTLRNILDGAKTILNLFPPPELPQMKPVGRYGYRTGRTDAEALASDWQAVGDDMRKVMGTLRRENSKTSR